ncbi:right-handed parallel beta-helix repeat-containing protein [Cohnella cellulosilytica]|uniref:Right-handed parallel beta-helix repeat-containing protein n=1 Tax=Cohnella cellulosilytica TaxID=986710 RepID=A0ABW2FI28_9BACL
MTMDNRYSHQWYVSPGGDDNNIGTIDRPFRTIGRARDEARKGTASMTGDFRIWIREGTYAQTEALVFDSRDSAPAGFRIVYAAVPGESVTISGGVRVENWVEVDDAEGRRLFQASAKGLPYSRHLYVNGSPAPRPRSKEIKATSWNVAKDEDFAFWHLLETVTTYQGELSVYEGYRTTRTDMLGWSNPQDVEAVYDVGWTHSVCPIESIRSDGADSAVVRMKMPCFRDCQIKAGVQIGSPSYFENVFELMNEPGQWYFDRSGQTVYYYARDGEDVAAMEFVIPLAERLIDIRGELGSPVRGLAFDGLEFCHTTFLQPLTSGHPEVQANLLKDSRDDAHAHSAYLKVPSAIVLHAAEDVRFENCRFHRLGSGAVDIETGSRRNAFVGNEFAGIAGSGIQVGDFSFADAHPDDEREIVGDNVIANNYFHEIGTDFKGSVAVIVGYAEGTAISHNEICEIAYSGISVGWGWGYADPGVERLSNFAPDHYPVYDKPTVLRRTRVEYNHIHHVLRKLHDGGGIYTLSAQPESVINGNYIHDNGSEPDVVCVEDIVRHTYGNYEKYGHYGSFHGFPGGIYLDEASAEFEISNNVIHSVIMPIHYHEVVKNAFRTLSIFGNVTNILPESPLFPAAMAARAGLEEPYRHLLDREGEFEPHS